MSLRDHLQSIYDSNGMLTPGLVVRAARPKKSPLHSFFEWDDKVAGPKWREHQASELIRSVKIRYVSGDKTEECRYFVSVQQDDGYAYQPADEVAKDPVLTEVVLRTMEREWRQLQSRYGHFAEFVEMVQKTLKKAS